MVTSAIKKKASKSVKKRASPVAKKRATISKTKKASLAKSRKAIAKRRATLAGKLCRCKLSRKTTTRSKSKK